MSILSDPVIVRLLKTKFIPVAVDQHDQRRRRDAEGQFFARILKQAGRGLDGYSQGFYLFTPAGKLLEFDNTLSGRRMKTMRASALKRFDPSAPVPRIEEGAKARRLPYQAPKGGLVVSVQAKVLGGYGKNKTGSAVYENSLGTDHLWIRKKPLQQVDRQISIRFAIPVLRVCRAERPHGGVHTLQIRPEARRVARTPCGYCLRYSTNPVEQILS